MECPPLTRSLSEHPAFMRIGSLRCKVTLEGLIVAVAPVLRQQTALEHGLKRLWILE
jgi:hypothetical protein